MAKNVISNIVKFTDPEDILKAIIRCLNEQEEESEEDDADEDVEEDEDDDEESISDLEEMCDSSTDLTIIDETGKLKIHSVYEEGGHEGGGETVIRVYEINHTIGDRAELFWIMVEAYYASYNGIDWSSAEFTFAKPYTFTETRYKETGL